MTKEPTADDNKDNHDFETAVAEPHYRQVQTAHETYFKDINDVYAQSIKRSQLIQMDYERSVENAFQKQDQDAWRSAGEEYQRAQEASCSDTSVFGEYANAYTRYKAALKEMMASANPDDMNFTDMTNLSQSLSAVSQTAMRLSCGQPATNNNPFE